MNSITPKVAFATTAALALWAVETWFLVDAAGYALTPTVAAIPVATAVLAFLPLGLEDHRVQGRGWLRLAMLSTFVFLAGHVLSSVVERTGGALDTKISQASAATEGRKLLEAELANARERVSDAEAEVKRESRNGGCKSTCEAWRKTAKERQDRVDKLTAELQHMPAYIVGDSVAYRLSKMFGFSEETISLWRPVMLPFGCMLGIWALFAFAAPVSRQATVSKAVTERQEPITDAEIEELRRILAASRAPLTNQDVADRLAVSKGEASKRISRAVEAGVLCRERNGRHVAVSLLN